MKGKWLELGSSVLRFELLMTIEMKNHFLLVIMSMMQLQGKVCLKAVPCYIFLVILLCIPLVIILDYRGTGEEAFLNVLIDPSTGEINKKQVGLLWINCRQDLNDLLQAFEGSKLCRLEETFSNVRHPELEQALFNCIRKNNIIFQREHGGFYTRHFKSLFRRYDVPVRILSPKDTVEAPDSDLGPSPSSLPLVIHAVSNSYFF